MQLRILGCVFGFALCGCIPCLAEPASNSTETKPRQSGSEEATAIEGPNRDFDARLAAAKMVLAAAEETVRAALKHEIDRAAQQGRDEQVRLRVAEAEFFEETGFVPAASPKWKMLRSAQRTACDEYRRQLKAMSQAFPDHRDQLVQEVLEFSHKWRVDLTGTWSVKYPAYAVSRPYAFVDDGQKVAISSEGHAPTRLKHSLGELTWDKEHAACSGEIVEVFTDHPRECRNTLRIEILDPNTLEVADWLVDATGKKMRIRLRYHRLE